MARTTADDRLRRMLAIVPWIAAHPEGASITEVCERFDIERAELLSDLDVVFMVGLYPFSPDQLIDVAIEGDRVELRYAEVFRRPLRLTPGEGLALVTAAAGLLSTPWADPDGPLARAVAKLSSLLSITPDEIVDVELGQARAETLATLRQALEEQRVVRLDYYSHGRDERTTREVEPWSLWSAEGNWYLTAHCRLAKGERAFRLDRVVEAELLDERYEPPTAGSQATPLLSGPGLPQVVLELGPEHAWLPGSVPVSSVERSETGRMLVTLGVAERSWLERLLLQLGPTARVVSIDPRIGPADLLADAALRVLDRYDAVGGGPPDR